MKCEKCNSETICVIKGTFHANMENKERTVSGLSEVNMNRIFHICLNCGQVEGKWPSKFPFLSSSSDKEKPEPIAATLKVRPSRFTPVDDEDENQLYHRDNR